MRWSAEENALLGKISDEEVARRTGRSVQSVRNCRHSLGLPLPNPALRRWTAQEEVLLGKCSDKDAARYLGRSVAAVYLRRRMLKIAPASQP